MSILAYFFFLRIINVIQQQKRKLLSLNSQQSNWGWPHVFFVAILSYPTSYSITSLINTSFFITSTNVILGLLLPFFFSFDLNKSTHQRCIDCSPLHMSKAAQAPLPYFFINRSYPYL